MLRLSIKLPNDADKFKTFFIECPQCNNVDHFYSTPIQKCQDCGYKIGNINRLIGSRIERQEYFTKKEL